MYFERLTILNHIINFLNPPKCIACRTEINDQVGLCLSCWGEMQFINKPICDVTGTPLPYGVGPFGADDNMLSIEALDNPPHYDKARIAVKYNDPSRQLIHKLKYYDQQHIAPLMAKMMVYAAQDLLAEQAGEALICPVPLYHWRYFRRRFNQADLLARQVAKQSGAPYAPLLVKRIKQTKTQVGLTRSERQSNVKGAFKINSKWIERAHGKKIYIVDDVVTTGATVDEISACLKSVGIETVYILAFAKVIHDKVI